MDKSKSLPAPLPGAALLRDPLALTPPLATIGGNVMRMPSEARAAPGPGAPGHTGAADADADLLAACAAFDAVAERLDALAAHPCQKPLGDPETTAYETEIETVNERWNAAVRAVTAFPATSATGLAAKVRMAGAVMRELRGEGDAPGDDLMLSLLADLRAMPGGEPQRAG